MAKKLVINAVGKTSERVEQTQAEKDQSAADKASHDAKEIAKAEAKVIKKLRKDLFLNTLSAEEQDGLIAILEDGNID